MGNEQIYSSHILNKIVQELQELKYNQHQQQIKLLQVVAGPNLTRDEMLRVQHRYKIMVRIARQL